LYSKDESLYDIEDSCNNLVDSDFCAVLVRVGEIMKPYIEAEYLLQVWSK